MRKRYRGVAVIHGPDADIISMEGREKEIIYVRYPILKADLLNLMVLTGEYTFKGALSAVIEGYLESARKDQNK